MAARRSEVTIDLAALRGNVRRLRELVAPAELWAVVKADAYGHGAQAVSAAALDAGATALCVVTAQEGESLRRSLPRARILVMGPLAPGEVELVRDARLEAAISTPDAPEGVPLHAKVDTGMGRWGMSERDLRELDPARLVGLMSHLATADEADAEHALRQLARFRSLSARYPGLVRHVANSAAAIRFPDARLDAVRCGIALYGCSPFGDDPRSHGLEPVLSWRSHVALVKTLQAGEGAGYGRAFVAEAPTRIGVVPVGYGDGFRRAMIGAQVLVGGARRRVVGRVSMDAFTIELPEGEVGDEVTLIGGELLAEEHARHLDTITYELTCAIDTRPGRADVVVVHG